MPTYLQRWEAAKTKFTNETGVKKPEPKGFFNSFFNHSGLTSALKDMDAAVASMPVGAKAEDMPKLIKNATEKANKLSSAIKQYSSVLSSSAKMEKAENNAKTNLYRNLKVLDAELNAIDTGALQFADGKKVAWDSTVGAKEKAGKMMKASLANACALAVSAVKQVQAKPTPETFNALFKLSDSPGRKIQVQLVTAAKELEAGKLETKRIDPRTLADKFTPWQAQTSANNSLPPTATAQDVTKRLEEFKVLLKMALDYSANL